MPAPAGLMAALQAKQAGGPKIGGGGGGPRLPPPPQKKKKEEEPTATIPEGKLFHFEAEKEQFLFDLTKQEPMLTNDTNGNADVDILVPLAPCVYRMTDYTIAKKQPVEMRRCIIKLGVLRCLQRECKTINNLLWSRLSPSNDNAFGAIDLEADSQDKVIKLIGGTIEEDELGKVRFMELLSNCGKSRG